MQFTILDERGKWFGPAIAAAERRGYDAKRIFRGTGATGRSGLGFIRPTADPRLLHLNHRDDAAMRTCLTMVQDRAQVEAYDNKSEQFRRWGRFMPKTWRFTDVDGAMAFLDEIDCPDRLVSKADEGASSVNVRILDTRGAQRQHVREIFGRGIPVDHCFGESSVRTRQTDYVLFQEFIPHTVTWRVNRIGNHFAVFKRYCYPDRNVAQTGNVEPVMSFAELPNHLVWFMTELTSVLKTKWVALDLLCAPDQGGTFGWYLLETSLAWPWPSPGTCDDAPFFGRTEYRWRDMWDLMFDEYEAGAWSS